jgi:TolB-like protein/Tfp pilus assembly protein PilF
VTGFEAAIECGDCQAAVDLYTGPFLDGFYLPNNDEFERWADAERERLRRAYLGALESLSDQAVALADHSAAVERLRALAAMEPFSSRIALRLITVLDAMGERAATLQHARVHETLVREELGIEPGEEWLQTIEKLRSPAAVAARPNTPLPVPTREHDIITTTGTTPETSHDITSAHERLRPRTIAMVTLSVVVIAAAIVGPRFMSRAGALENSSIAVLPFADHSPRAANQYFADGLTEELINTLSRATNLKVAARTSVFALKGASVDVKEAGRRLQVSNLLEGSVRQSNGQLRISVQLVDAATGYELWSDVFDRSTDDALTVQEEIARAIVNTLKGRLLDHEAAAITSTPIDSASYDLYLRGRYHWHRRSQRDLEQAIAYFEQAVKLSPTHARAWSGLADAYAICGFYDYLPPDTAFPRAQATAERALDLDARFAAAYATLGYIELYYRWNFARAEEQFRHALSLDPNYSTGHQWYANLLTAAGRFADGQHAMRQAQRLDPLSLIANAALGWSMYFARSYSEADQQLRQTMSLDSTFQLAYLWQAWVREEFRDFEGAHAAIQHGVELSDSSAIYVTALARIEALRGNRSSATALLERLNNRKFGYAPSYELAKVHLGLGQSERALDLLERAINERSHSIAFIRVDPQLDPVRMHPRFLGLLEKTGL